MMALSSIFISSKLVCRRELEVVPQRGINLRKVFYSFHSEIFKAHFVVGVQQISKRFGRLELRNCISLGFFKKGTQLVIPLLKVIKMSILLYGISLQLLNIILQLFGIVLGLGRHLSPLLALILNPLDPRL